MSDEKRLIKHLLDNYAHVGIVGRPVYNTTDTVKVQYGMALIQILDLNEKDQVLTTNFWCRYVSSTRRKTAIELRVITRVQRFNFVWTNRYIIPTNYSDELVS